MDDSASRGDPITSIAGVGGPAMMAAGLDDTLFPMVRGGWGRGMMVLSRATRIHTCVRMLLSEHTIFAYLKIKADECNRRVVVMHVKFERHT